MVGIQKSKGSRPKARQQPSQLGGPFCSGQVTTDMDVPPTQGKYERTQKTPKVPNRNPNFGGPKKAGTFTPAAQAPPEVQNAKWRRKQWYSEYMKSPTTRLPIITIPKKVPVPSDDEPILDEVRPVANVENGQVVDQDPEIDPEVENPVVAEEQVVQQEPPSTSASKKPKTPDPKDLPAVRFEFIETFNDPKSKVALPKEHEPKKDKQSSLMNSLNFIVSNGQRQLSSSPGMGNFIRTEITEDESVWDTISENLDIIMETFVELSCGHFVQFYSPDPTKEVDPEVKCPAPCNRYFSSCGHPCRKYCYEDCGFCEETQVVVYPCSHEATIPCRIKGTALDICEVQVASNVPSSCGHPVTLSCALKDRLTPNQVAQKCKEPCGMESVSGAEGCGHVCQGTCRECCQGRFHVRCSQPCGRTLICGHVCTSPCSQACPPCGALCEAECEHGHCTDDCGVPCEQCEEPCVWKCPHQKCIKKCSEICDREPCDEPCPKILSCGHPCVSFCGDPCPKLCRICNTEQLEAGLILSKDFVEESDRFVLLEDCGHAIEREMLDQWMNIENHESEIYPKTCPLCRHVIYRSRRYIRILHKIRLDVDQIKLKIYGDISQIEKILGEVKDLLSLDLDLFKEFKNYLQTRDFPMLNLRESESLAFLTRIWFETQYKMADLKTHIPEFYVSVLESSYTSLFQRLMERKLPLRPLELRDLRRQMDRFHDMSQLFERKSRRLNETAKFLMNTPEAVEAFEAAQGITWRWVPYDEELKAQFRVAIQRLDQALQCKLRISDAERAEILRAVGLSSGRWFKCPNGHIYLITECGGATQLSTCSECGVLIGGEQHQVLIGNRLATEMDGALTPAYPGAIPY